MNTTNCLRRGSLFSPLRIIALALLLLSFIHSADAYTTNPYFAKNRGSKPRPVRWGPPEKRDSVPLVISNQCSDTIWPGIGTQAGTGAGTGGFELESGSSRSLSVSADWQGRIWGRTNCSFNPTGSGASNLNGNNGGGAACQTGDCGGVLSCVLTGATPVTLAEFNLQGGSNNDQTFYDISLVDGYNIPVGIIYIPGDNPELQDLPPNLTNPTCVATAGWVGELSDSGLNGNSSNSTYPIPYESKQTNEKVAKWCPWDLQVTQPTKPGDGVYPYPDDNIQRPMFDPCLSACAKTNSPSDCCTGKYDSPDKCSASLYSNQAKAVCPDAYSFAFDDQTSTFIIPTGGGWEVTFCPPGRSTNILKTFQSQLQALSQQGHMTKAILSDLMNITIINEGASSGSERSRGETPSLKFGSTGALVVMVAWAVLW